MEEFESIVGNRVLVEPMPWDDYINIGDNKFFLDVAFHPGHHSPRRGIVRAVPDKLTFDKSRAGGLSVLVPMELKVGDNVWFHYMNIHNPHNSIDGLYFMDYEGMIAYERDGEIHACAGHIIYTPVEKKGSEGIVKSLSEMTGTDEYEEQVYQIEYVGVPVEMYKDNVAIGHEVASDESIDLAPGDLVLMKRNCKTPIEYEMHQTLMPGRRHVYKGRRSDVLAKVKYK